MHYFLYRGPVIVVLILLSVVLVVANFGTGPAGAQGYLSVAHVDRDLPSRAQETATPTSTATSTATLTLTPTGTSTSTPTSTQTPTSTPTSTTTPTGTPTGAPTTTETPTSTPTTTSTPTSTPTATATATVTLTPTPTALPPNGLSFFLPLIGRNYAVPTPVPVRYAGTTNQNMAVELHVLPDFSAVTRFRMRVRVTCPEGTLTATVEKQSLDGWPITGRQFEIRSSVGWSDLGIPLSDIYTGEFDPTFTTVQGTWTQWLVLGGEPICNHEGTWSASRQP